MNIVNLYEVGRITPVTATAYDALNRVNDLLVKANKNLRNMLDGKPVEQNPIDLRNQARIILTNVKDECIIR